MVRYISPFCKEQSVKDRIDIPWSTAVVEIPFLSELFGFAHLDMKAYLISLGLAALIIPAVEIIKAIQRAISKNTEA